METYFKPKKIEIKPETVAEDLEKGNKGTGINHEKDLEKIKEKRSKENDSNINSDSGSSG
nr:8440_t:CDS:2 [Entrophospora candida]